MPTSDHIVADGEERLRKAIVAPIGAAVRAEYSERLANANFLRRIRLRLVIRREVRRQIDALASSSALY